MKKTLLVSFIILFPNLIFSQQKTNVNNPSNNKYYDYGEVIAAEIPKPKFVQVKPMNIDDFQEQTFTIETLGYSEIRVFAELSKDDYKKAALPKASRLKLIFVNEMTGLGSPYKTHIFKNEVTSMIDAWVIEKIFGRKTKVIVTAENIPQGKYTIHFSYYLLP